MTAIEGLLLDLDGTVYLADSLLPGVARAIDELRSTRVPFLFTTNTSRKSRADVARSLNAMGLEVRAEEIFTAPVAAAGWLREEGIQRIHLLVPDSTRADFAEFEITPEGAEAVLVGDLGAEFTFDRMNEGFRSLRSGARLVAIHRNRFWLTAAGPTLDAGPFVAALEYASGQQATLVGKPSPAFFDTAARLLGVARDGLAVVGDDFETDVCGGRAAGLTTIQVRTGKFDPRLLREAASGEQPDHLVDGIADVPALLS